MFFQCVNSSLAVSRGQGVEARLKLTSGLLVLSLEAFS